jgi:transcriptional regulator with XRE-family HTH domain
MKKQTITKAEIARQLGVSRAYVTMLCNGKKKASDDLILKIKGLAVNKHFHNSNPKSCSSANSDTSPIGNHLIQ